MRSQAQKDTSPELDLRRELHRRGLRYRIHQAVGVPRRRHDVVFSKSRVVVEVRGCFWHACPSHGTLPKANREWWRDKLEKNRMRDQDTEFRLKQAGWNVIIVWEHEEVVSAADRVQRAVTSIAE